MIYVTLWRFHERDGCLHRNQFLLAFWAGLLRYFPSCFYFTTKLSVFCPGRCHCRAVAMAKKQYFAINIATSLQQLSSIAHFRAHAYSWWDYCCSVWDPSYIVSCSIHSEHSEMRAVNGNFLSKLLLFRLPGIASQSRQIVCWWGTQNPLLQLQGWGWTATCQFVFWSWKIMSRSAIALPDHKATWF